MVYIKAVVMNIGLNTWGLVLYNNVLALVCQCMWCVILNAFWRSAGVCRSSFHQLSSLWMNTKTLWSMDFRPFLLSMFFYLYRCLVSLGWRLASSDLHQEKQWLPQHTLSLALPTSFLLYWWMFWFGTSTQEHLDLLRYSFASTAGTCISNPFPNPLLCWRILKGKIWKLCQVRHLRQCRHCC